MPEFNYIILAQIILALPVCFLLTNLTKFLAEKLGFVNNPNPIVQSHKTSTAYGGGIAISATLVTYLIFQITYFHIALYFIFVLLPIVILGLFDDIFRLSPLVKFLLQLISALPFLFILINITFIFALIFLLFILSSQNAWNLIDIMDGLTAGISFIIFFSMGVILASNVELLFYSYLSFAIAFSVLGFRFLNKSPAKIFLGETGSLLLGSFFAFIVISTFQVNVILAFYIVLLGSIPFFELIFLIIIRTKKGIPFYRGSPDHFALRMLNHGYSVNIINNRTLLICTIHSLTIIVGSIIFGDFYLLIVCMIISVVSFIIAFFYFQSLPVHEISK